MIGRIAAALYRVAIRCYPRRFRDQYGEEMLHVFVARGEEMIASGRTAKALRTWLRSLCTDCASGLRLRFQLAKGTSTSLSRLPPNKRQPGFSRGGRNIMGDIIRDLQFSGRMLKKNPLFTAAAVITLALGIGLNAATYSAVNGLLLKPLGGVAEPDEVVLAYRRWADIEFGSNSVPHFQSLRDLTRDDFDGIATWGFFALSLSSDGQNERVIGMIVSAGFFQMYGVVPAMGRVLLPGVDDVAPGAHPVVVLGHSFWQSRFGGDSSVVGKTVLVNGQSFNVVGVTPPEFRGPVNFAEVPMYAPLMMVNELAPGRNLLNSRSNNSLDLAVRMRDNQTIEQAQAVFDAALLQLREEFPGSYETQLGTTLVRQTESGIHPSIRSAQVGFSAVMMAVVSILLLIACVNVANLFLARARERRREMGIRLSLGAGRRRIVQQLLTESTVLSLISGTVGLGIAHLALSLLGGVRPPIDGPFSFTIQMDNRVLLFTFGVSVLAGILFGLAPALQTANPNTMAAVKGDSGDRARRANVGSVLVVLQMALSLLLLISSGLFLRSLKGATQIDPGFDEPAHLLLASVDPGLQGYDRERARDFYEELVREVQELPGVVEAGLTTTVPLGLSNSSNGISIPGYEFAEGERRSISYAAITAGYLEAMGTSLLEGRFFTELDGVTGTLPMIVNQRFADRFWPNESAIGKTVRSGGADHEIIGVVETGKYASLGEEPAEFMYLTHADWFRFAMSLVARTTSPPEGVLRGIRGIVRTLDGDMPLYDVRTMEDHMGTALLPARLGAAVLGIFGTLGLVLAAVGIYGVMSYSVVQRTRELGIRIALGATTASVVRQVLSEGMRLTAVGMGIGLLGAAGAAQLVKGLLYNVGPLDPVSFLGVPTLLIAVAAAAVLLPARRAASVAPVKALKTE